VGRERCQGYAQQQEGGGRGVRPVPGAVRAGGGGLENPGHDASSTTYGCRTITHWHDQVTPEEPHPFGIARAQPALLFLDDRGDLAVDQDAVGRNIDLALGIPEPDHVRARGGRDACLIVRLMLRTDYPQVMV